ncbi:hypothetical protein SteCoe_7498 [Stentor coeruleus]|uniref:Uncharacterized protein n=1 Tax=Stentor coeruleus TaxID=5963 RepID=A0A1R2CMI3_9CILI|nr:hypothetical protein SteCoe_7498 [Stentor coeruleus]
MLKIRKPVRLEKSKGELTASNILEKISNKEYFNVSEYFKPKSTNVRSLPKINVSTGNKTEKKLYYNQWEAKNSMKYLKNFRMRNKEVIDKIKIKSTELCPVDFALSL